MKRTTLALAGMSLALAACASAPQQTMRPQTAPAAVAQTPTDRDAAEFRAALENAYQQIEARSTAKDLPQVDADAALSMTIPDHRTVRGAINYFSTGLKDKIQESLYRSAKYKTLIDGVLDEYGLPRAFAYLPVIESAYIPTLTSRSGAHGIWQFMPATAREMGLRVDWWVDERANPEKSTRAAAKYLKSLYQQFGDWPLVLAAYNCGPGCVKRAMQSTGSTTFWELLEQNAVPKETRGYVPTFFATITIASDPQTYGFELQRPIDHHGERIVNIPGPVSLNYLAEVTGTSVDDLRAMNPEYRRGVLPPGRAPIRLPEAAAKIALARASDLRDEDPYMEVATFTLRPGDTLKSLASAAGIAREDILKMNDLASDDSVNVGDSIYLPIQQAKLSNVLRRRSQPADSFYTVSQGDTLYSIAKNNGLSVDELRELNQLASEETIQPGQRLRVSLGTALTGGM